MMPLPLKSQPSPMGAQFPSVVTAVSRNASCANLSDVGNDNSTGEGLETFDVGEYHFTSCPICLEHFTLDNPAILLKCEHGFHLQCLESWRQRSSVCPMCFTPVIGDEGRIMTSADARRRRRLRHKAGDSAEKSVLIDAASTHGCGGAGCVPADFDVTPAAEHEGETEVFVVSSAEEEPHNWLCKMWCCCCCCCFFS